MKTNNLEEFFSKHKILIPSYQRVYTWDKTEINYYLTDLKEDIKKNRTSNFGVVYYEDSGNVGNTYQIIDGQQRLTTSVLILVTIAIRNRDLSNVKKFAKKILEKESFDSDINELKKVYQEFYIFLNKAFESDEFTFEQLCGFFGPVPIPNEGYFTVDKNDLLYAMKTINTLFNEKDEDKHSDFPSQEVIAKQILEAEFHLIENPYKDDPISIFERLNNRGKELSFISMTKIRIYEFFDNALKKEGVENVPQLALKYMNTYTTLIYSIFNNSRANFKIENRDSRIEESLVEYLSIKFMKNIPRSRTERLLEFDNFLTKEDILKDKDVNNPFAVLSAVFHEFLIYASVSQIGPIPNLKTLYYLNDSKYSKELDKLWYIPKDDVINKLIILDTLDQIKLKKFKPFYRYITTQIIMDKGLLPKDADERENKLFDLVSYILKWTAVSYVSHVASDFTITFREDMELFEFIEEYEGQVGAEKINKLLDKLKKDSSILMKDKSDKFKIFNNDLEKSIIKKDSNILKANLLKSLIEY